MLNSLSPFKYLFNFTLFFCFSIISLTNSAQCTIEELHVLIEKDCSNSLFDVELDFNFANTSDSFHIVGNGLTYGTYAYLDLPVTLSGLNADCTLPYEFVIIDKNDSSCSDFEEVGIVCCNCSISDIVLTAGTCNNNMDFDLQIDFNFTNNVGDTFNYEVPGLIYGSENYNNLPLTINVENNTDPSLLVIICDEFGVDCCDTSEVLNPCFAPPACEIWDVTADVALCENSFFDVIIEFNYVNTSDSFDIVGNGISYGTYAYNNAPITLSGLPADCDTQYEFVIVDQADNNCSDFVELGDVCCDPCELTNLTLIAGACTNGEFELIIDFDHSGTTNDFFDYEIPGVIGGFAAFEDLPITIVVNDAIDSLLTLFICENDNPSCCINEDFVNPCYNAPLCEIWDVTADVALCENSLFDVIIEFNYVNTSDSFDIVGNGISYGTYAYNNATITLSGLPADCDTQYEFVIVDQADNNCSDFVELGDVCCDPCELTNLTLIAGACTNGEFELIIDFDHSGTTNDFFDYEIPGAIGGFAAFEDLPITIVVNDATDSLLTLFICENDNLSCCINEDFVNPCYNAPLCEIWDVIADVVACDTGFFFVDIDFNYAHTSDSFYLAGNGMNYGNYAYVDLPVTLLELPADCDTEYEFIVHDLLDNNCNSFVELGEVCCGDSCALTNIIIDTSPCVNDTFEILIDFDYSGNSNNFFNYEIPGITSGTALFADLPIIILVIGATDSLLNIVICENDTNNTCCITGVFENRCYSNPQACEIYDLTALVEEDCDSMTFDVEIDFDNGFTSDTFRIVGNSINYGNYAYANLPITLSGLSADCSTDYEFIIIDNEDNDCKAETGIGQVCCSDSCMFSNLILDTSPCENGSFELLLDFDFNGTTNNFFDYEIPGVTSGTALFADLPITLNITNPTDTLLTITICENDNPNCCIIGTFENRCINSPQNCELSGMTAVVDEDCESNSFLVSITFNYSNTSDSFYILGNGNNYGNFAYQDLPVILDSLDPDCETFYEFIAVDLMDNDCSTFTGIGQLCCPDSCDLFNLYLDTSPCENDSFELLIDFDFNGTVNDFFDYEIPGVTSGTSLFEDLPLVIVVTGATDSILSITICENDNPICCITGTFENRCIFDPQNCEVWDLSTDIQFCDNGEFDIEIDFNYNNTSDSFYIAGNGNNYGTYAYIDAPITLNGLLADCMTPYEFAVIDNQDQNCSDYIFIDTVCCGGMNRIQQIDLIITQLNGDSVSITLDVDHTTLPACFIDVYLDGEKINTLNHEEYTFSLGDYHCGDNTILALSFINSCLPSVTYNYEINVDEIACTTSTFEEDEYVHDVIWDKNQNEVLIHNPTQKQQSISLISLNGNKIWSLSNKSSRWTKDLSELQSGMYILEVIVRENGQTTNRKVKKVVVF